MWVFTPFDVRTKKEAADQPPLEITSCESFQIILRVL